jgi:tRNA (cytidine/uridine-2'-O-)-methyltransferase
MFHVVLVEPEIPPNTGNVGRLCLATNTRLHLIEPLGFSIDDKQLKRAGLDYWKDVDCHVWPSLAALQAASSEEITFHYFTTKASEDYWSASYGPDDYLVFGCETRGLPESLLQENLQNCLV